MAANHKIITYFLEDQAQEAFISAMVNRLAREVGVSVRHDTRSVAYGGRPLTELRRFLRDEQRRPASSTDLLVVSIDGNCHGPNEKRREIRQIIERIGYSRPYVCAVPDPHVERWYLCDGEAVRQALSANVEPLVPAYKCERDRYKQELRRVILEADQSPVIGGAEHGEAIVGAMDLYRASQHDSSLAQFIEELRSALRSLTTRI